MASSSSFQSLSLEQVLEDLSSRFIVNLPAEELESIERICFQIEQAHWYYEDFVRPQASHLPSFNLRKFSEIVFRINSLLSDYDPTAAYDHFLKYKERVPVCGAIILNQSWDKCLVVKGWKSGASWSFPRGKINQGEDERDCAVREVWEETGYDVSPHFNPDVFPHDQNSKGCPPPLPSGDYPEDDYLEVMMKEQSIRLYVVPNVSEDTLFETKTRKEISRIAWAPLTDLPTWSKKNKGIKKDFKCYMITPFVAPLRAWIAQRKPSGKKTKGSHNVQSTPEQAIALDRLYHTYEDAGTAYPSKDADLEPGLSSHTAVPTLSAELEESSQALQALFFGSGSPSPLPPSATFEPSTAPAVKSPKTHSLPAFETPSYATSSLPLPHREHSRQFSPGSNGFLPNSQAYHPSPNRDNLLQLLQRDALGVSAPSDGNNAASTSVRTSASTTMAPSTVQQVSPLHRLPSAAIGWPNSGDCGALATSPSRITNERVMQSDERNNGPFTEQQREQARDAILLQLASQLGAGPTPPSPEEPQGSNRSSEEDDGSDFEAQTGAAPLQDLLEIFKQQMASDGIVSQMGDLRLTQSVLSRLDQSQRQQKDQQHTEMQDEAEARARFDAAVASSRKQQLAHGQMKGQGVTASSLATVSSEKPHLSGPNHPQTRDQILSILQPNPRSPPHSQPMAHPLQQQASQDGRPSQHVNLLDILNPAKNRQRHQPATMVKAQSRPANTPPALPYTNKTYNQSGPVALPDSSQATSLLSLFNSAPVGQAGTASPRTTVAPLYPPDFANGNRYREFQTLVEQDQSAHPGSSGQNGSADLARLFANATMSQ